MFCFFAEDTNIFEDNQFTNAIDSHTQTDGSDLNNFLDTLFYTLNTPKNKRESIPKYLNDFPYVNGGLFAKEIKSPKFSRKSRNAILNSGDQDWSAINPDIFGSMFQTVICSDQRENLGQHYTSVPNIMKVIEPLFLNELYDNFNHIIDSNLKLKTKQDKLKDLLHRIQNIKIFDPACGSGNFLIIAYKELRILEMKIFEELDDIPFSKIKLSNFYGIEIDDFAAEIAKLALWLAEHQMNIESFKLFDKTNPTLPLKEAGRIVIGNACRLNWETVCPKNQSEEIYILGNPPYLGSRNQEAIHKKDMIQVLGNIKGYKKLDYIACWFFKSSNYLKEQNIKVAFVTTNSICQGEQTLLFWPHILNKDVEIIFAHQSFKWKNNAKNNAGVTVVIIGLGRDCKKVIINDKLQKKVSKINPYLVEGDTFYINKRNTPLSKLPAMIYGSEPRENGNLLLTPEEKDIVLRYPQSSTLIKKITGATEYINSIERYCLWGEELLKTNIPYVIDRLQAVKKYRLTSKRKATREYSEKPHLFTSITYCEKQSIIVPIVSSENRRYIPTGYINEDTVILNSAQVIYDSEPYVLGILTSRMHMTWMRTVAGRLENRYRYSSTLVYNTFPFPKISTQRKKEITQSVFRILEEREKHSDKTLAELYDPDKMPDGLREAHHQNDLIIEKCYRSTPFKSDEERLEYLFKLYEKMIEDDRR